MNTFVPGGKENGTHVLNSEGISLPQEGATAPMNITQNIRKLVWGVAPGMTYDPTIDLLYEDDETPTVKRTALCGK